ncbi:hypothetical protein L218DRAFT_957921 [Marasmius fiardii PR-910]|nr:hypothetical protein L218DRAFT_957921 [Marasmius fiardii PR-910]
MIIRVDFLYRSNPPFTYGVNVDDGFAQATADGYGWTIWSRVATAAGSLTVNVSKAWASNIVTYAGEGMF